MRVRRERLDGLPARLVVLGAFWGRTAALEWLLSQGPVRPVAVVEIAGDERQAARRAERETMPAMSAATSNKSGEMMLRRSVVLPATGRHRGRDKQHLRLARTVPAGGRF